MPPAGRTELGRFVQGVSGNPRGRAKGIGGLIRSRTRDGEEMVEFALSVMRGEELGYGQMPSPKERLMALDWLSRYGWGKPDDYRAGDGKARIDPSRLTDAQAEQFLRLMEVAAVREPETVEADAVEVAKDATPKEEK